MSAEAVVDYVLIAALLASNLVGAWFTLRRTSRWTFLGRALFWMFVGKAVLWGYALLIRHVGLLDPWVLWAIRAELIVTNTLLIAAYVTHPWPKPPERIEWAGLLLWWRSGG